MAEAPDLQKVWGDLQADSAPVRFMGIDFREDPARGAAFADIPPGETWSGYPARPHKEALRAQAALFKLPSLLRTLERLVSRETAGPGDGRSTS